MQSRWILTISLMVLLAFSITLFSNIVEAKGNGKVRVIAQNDKELSDALANDCKTIKKAKSITALICSEDIASSLKLQEDIRMFAVDTGANSQIGADQVQSSGNTGQGRTIVVLDTGYNYNHPQLQSSYLGGKDFVNNDNDPFDDNGHGTHVAGIITSDGTGDSISKGVAPSAGIIAGKVLDATSSGYFIDVVAAIYWAVDGPDGTFGTGDEFNADAISLSLGSARPYTYKGTCDSIYPPMTNAIKYARDHNILVVVAAGNSGNAGVSLPGCVSYSTTVGAVDKLDKIASFSGIGKAVDVTAPGVSIYSTWLGTGYVTASGTSMATPMVSGTVALIKSAHPEYSDEQVEQALIKTAKDLGKRGFDTSYGWGRIVAPNAVK